jgi:ankyrin repeat protein
MAFWVSFLTAGRFSSAIGLLDSRRVKDLQRLTLHGRLSNMAQKRKAEHELDVAVKRPRYATEYELVFAARHGPLEIVSQSLDENPSSLHYRERTDETLLHSAVDGCQLEIVEYLIKRGADLNAQTNALNTPLHWCCQHNNDDIARLLVDAKSDLSACNISGQTPLHVAIINGNLDVARVLLAAGAPMDIQDRHGLTPLKLCVALKYGALDLVAPFALHEAFSYALDTLHPMTASVLAKHLNRARVFTLVLGLRFKSVYHDRLFEPRVFRIVASML